MKGQLTPKEWNAVQIADISIKGQQRKPTSDELFTYVDIGSIDRDSKVISKPQLLKGEDAPSRARKIINTGDVLVSLTRPNLNAVALVTEEYDEQIASTGFEVIKPINVDSRYIFALTRSKDFIDTISGVTQGALYPAAKSADVQAYTFLLPPLAEQKVIAEKLNTLLAQVEVTKARLESTLDTLKQFRQSVLAAAVSGKLTEDWRDEIGLEESIIEREIKSLAKDEKYSLAIGPFGSNLKVSDYKQLGKPLVFVREIRADRFGDNLTKFISNEKFEELKAHRVKPGDLLITKMGDPAGDVAIYPEGHSEAVITADCIKFTVDEDKLSKSYALYAMRSPLFRARIVQISAGVAQQKISLKNFRSLTLPVPSYEEQLEVARRVEKLFASADFTEQQVNQALERVNSLTQSILAKAFRGELTEQWRRENPELISGKNSAEALLKKIKAERAAAKPKRKTRKVNV
ncbi:restriction endonuclease subunit S [Vibrio parahaemolyticus]|uniref:restriction endonuclease subunit S n=1 Tax=Vibrio parahaemolyticus TaxID=670 RepID=UPI00111F7953|nr:restriction endonuclease subunit S [Vibrio parahaemolyticus]TOO92135.1 type I restriction endonuclease subunit S [Vibrio parahaemolyticus]TOO98440.1 type I restriction endonuclease subunit S [Vibrio parahaemolyticus]TOQ68387.1 type I restriction endonuclease subunit S [Vibrio parahaemolyticus]